MITLLTKVKLPFSNLAHNNLAFQMMYDIPDLEMTADITSQERAYQRLRHAILVGAIPTGATLTMRGLADKLGIGLTPIREALRRLNSEAAIQMQDNRRMLVPAMTAGRFDDLIATRIALETHAAKRALPYVSNVLIDSLQAIDAQMDAALSADDYDALTVLNQAFHSKLYCANPNQTSMSLVESVWLQLGPFQREVITALETFYVVDRHKEILTALETRNEAALVAAIQHDIEDGVGAAGKNAIASRSKAKIA